MSYQAIARKWRPQSFNELKGQSATRRTLFNAIKSDRLHHALLFTGPRGTGKTSTARIVAKILRCTNLQKDSTPCNKCTDCEEISSSRNLDVLEIDGASNNGVDSIRELRDQINFNPSSGTKKVYIIDEVHMLSSSAFNALLKTLEEPPEGVYFMMATTEVHKLPKTILSRCQRYNFKPIDLKEVVGLLKEICESEKVDYDEDALFLIAQAGDGSVRDSLSFLDQCITFADGKVTVEGVRENTGVMDISFFHEVLDIVLSKDSQKLVDQIKLINQKNIEPQVFLEEMVQHVKNLILFKVDPSQVEKNEHFSEAQRSTYSKLSQTVDLEDLYILFDICFKGTVDLVRAFNPFVLLEVTLLKAGTAPYYSELSGGMAAAPKKTQVQRAPQKRVMAQPASAPSRPAPSVQAESPQPKAPVSAQPAQSAKPSNLSGWEGFLEKVKSLNPVVGSKLEMCEYSYDKASKSLKIKEGARHQFLRDQISSQDFLDKVQNYVRSLWENGATVEYQSGVQEDKKKTVELKPSVQDQKEKKKDDKLEQAKRDIDNHDVIKAMKDKYKVEITDVKNSN